MANSKYEYVKAFERPDNLLPNTWIVIRLDGRGFHKFSARHGFAKPNDLRAITLSNAAAVSTLHDIPDITLAYGVSDEFSFLLPPTCTLFERREAKLTSTIVSTFTSYYTHLWPVYFPTTPLQLPLPSFDARAVCYPSVRNVRDYWAWRQVDCHVNNLYNTVFWALVDRGGVGRREAEERLKGTVSGVKHEVLWGLGINYAREEEVWRRGSVVFRELKGVEIDTPKEATATTTSTSITASTSTSTTDQFTNTATPIPSETPAPEKPDHDTDETTPPGKLHHKKKKLSKKQAKKQEKKLLRAAEIVVRHVDIIGDQFWIEHPYVLGEVEGEGVGMAGTR